MVIAFPWAGRDWNRAIAISGRAAMPGLPGGSGFNWPSVVGTTGMLRPRAALSGLGAMARRRRGLGQDSTDASGGLPYSDPSSIPSSTLDLSYYTQMIGNPAAQATVTPVGSSVTTPASTQAPWYAGLLNSLVSVGGQITNYELNPLTNKSTYIRTPQGGIIATNSPTGATGIPGLTTSSLSSMMPLLVIGGGLMVFMMMAKR